MKSHTHLRVASLAAPASTNPWIEFGLSFVHRTGTGAGTVHMYVPVPVVPVPFLPVSLLVKEITSSSVSKLLIMVRLTVAVTY